MKIALYIGNEKQFQDFAKQIETVLLELSPKIHIIKINDTPITSDSWEERLRAFPKVNINCLISVGSTGTFLRAIFFQRNSCPIIAASPEKVSFFTEITPSNVYEALKAIIDKNFHTEKLSRLALSLKNDQQPFLALNEIAIFPEISAQLMQYTLSIDNNLLYRGRADGLIIATPLGSTGYALSSGGPIAFGQPQVLIVVPVNPLNRDHYPAVIPSSSEIILSNLSAKVPLCAIIDGQLRIDIGTVVTIKQSSNPIKIIRFDSKRNIVAKLRNRIVELDLHYLEGAPPSAKYIFKLLLSEGEMTQKEIIESTGLPNRTVRNALRILKEKGVIRQRPYLKDARQSIYFVAY